MLRQMVRDFVREVANTILGARAAPLRELQREWKARLADSVRRVGYEVVARALRGAGARVTNLEYRLSEQSLRTQDQNDFTVLMQFLGLGDMSQELWDAMGELDSAHRRAEARVDVIPERDAVSRVRRAHRNEETCRQLS